MPIALVSSIVQGTRRVRLLFSEPLHSSAFATSYFSIVSESGDGTNPTVALAFIVPGSPSAIELSVDTDWTEGSVYTLTCTAVPALGGGTPFTGTDRIGVGASRQRVDVEQVSTNVELALFGRDLVHNGLDYQETVDGDLAVIEGEPNARGAIERRVFGEGLTWDPTYGAKPEEYVDAVAFEATTLHGAIVSQVMADDRSESVQVTFQQDEEKTFFEIWPKLRGSAEPKAITLKI